MRVGVIAYPLDRPVRGGVDRYIHRLAREFMASPRAADFVWIHGKRWEPGHPMAGHEQAILPEHGLRGLFVREGWGKRNTGALDVLWGPYFGVLPGPFAKVMTVHDLYEMTARDGPLLQSLRFRAVTRRMVKRSDYIMVDSEASRKQLLDVFGYPQERAVRVPLGVDPPPAQATSRNEAAAELRRAHGWPFDARVILFVSNIRERKDTPTLARAFAALRERLPAARLLLFGVRSTGWSGLERTLRDLGLAHSNPGDPVQFPFDLSDEALERCYAGADVLALSSIFEGFGISPLEAMARGVPTVMTRGGALEEIGAGASLLVPVGDHVALAAALEKVLTDEGTAAELVRAGRERAAQFEWATCARETLAVLERAANRA